MHPWLIVNHINNTKNLTNMRLKSAPKTVKSKATTAESGSKGEALKLAAIQCIRKYGASKVSVDDIAAAAGVGRRSFYRFFDGRQAIMEAILVERMEASAVEVKTLLGRCKNFEEAIIAGTIESLRLLRKDKIYNSIAASERNLMLALEHDKRGALLGRIMLSVWGDVFNKARGLGVLRVGISNQDAADWLISVHDMLLQRGAMARDKGDVNTKEILRKFILPSLMRDGIG